MLGADQQSSGAARWAVSEPNMMNVAATRAKKEFYIIGDKKLYLGLGCDVVTDTERIIRQYKKQFPDLVDDEVNVVKEIKKAVASPKAASTQTNPGHKTRSHVQTAETQTPVVKTDSGRVTGTVKYVGKGRKSFYAYVTGDDGKEYSITESIYSRTDHAKEIIQKGNKISFVPEEGKKKALATDVKEKIFISLDSHVPS